MWLISAPLLAAQWSPQPAALTWLDRLAAGGLVEPVQSGADDVSASEGFGGESAGEESGGEAP